jgi:hypothetical protein
MIQTLSDWIDRLSEFFSQRKGLLPLIGILFVVLNFVFQFFPLGWLSGSNFCLHFGIVIAILGFMLAWAL